MLKPHCFYSPIDFSIGKCFQKTPFDTTLLSSWKYAEYNGALNYKIKECDVVSKTISVNECSFVVTLNEKRFSERRKPQEMTSLNQLFDSSKFNFTKVKNKEILMTIGPDSKINQVQNAIIVNASPFEEGHSLLVPELSSCHNQVMRKNPLKTALDTILISGEEHFVIAYNSMLACASLNHLHFHLWINKQSIMISYMDLKPLLLTNDGKCIFSISNHVVHNLVVVFSDIQELDTDFSLLWTIVETVQKLEIPHSICFVRSSEHIRCVIWPRKIETDNNIKLWNNEDHNIMNVAVAELAGQIFTGDKELFENYLDSNLLERSFNKINVSEQTWNEIIKAIQNILSDNE